jgi:hypothetical protein
MLHSSPRGQTYHYQSAGVIRHAAEKWRQVSSLERLLFKFKS